VSRRRKLTAAVVLPILTLGSAGAAVADQGGTPNENACHGTVVSTLARQGYSPATLARRIPGETVAGLNQRIRELCAVGGSGAALGAVQKVREAASLPPGPQPNP
jgi:hypothetical protein